MTQRRILYLATDAYGGRGGIALYNRDALAALAASADFARPVVFPRIAGDGSDEVPANIDWRPVDREGKLAYMTRVLGETWRHGTYDLIYCAHVNLLPVAAMAKVLTGSPILLAIYGFEAWTPLRRLSARRALQRVDHCLTISDYTGDRFRQWSGIAPDRLHLCPNAVNLEQFGMGPKRPDLVERYGLGEREVVMLFGRMDSHERHKGFDELIDAFPAIRAARPRAKLLLAGDGSHQSALMARIGDMGLNDHVAFTGHVPEEEKADHYRLADAYVMPSRQEGFGFVHLEAMACGIPAVASACDGAREAVRNGLIGRLVDPADPDDIVRQTVAALDTPKHVPEGLSHFRFEAFADRLRSIALKATAPA